MSKNDQKDGPQIQIKEHKMEETALRSLTVGFIYYNRGMLIQAGRIHTHHKQIPEITHLGAVFEEFLIIISLFEILTH